MTLFAIIFLATVGTGMLYLAHHGFEEDHPILSDVIALCLLIAVWLVFMILAGDTILSIPVPHP